MVMSSTGGMGKHMTAAIKRLAVKISEKRNESYSLVICMLRCKLVFAMMRSALVCLRGSRSLKPNKSITSSAMSLDTPASVVLHETRLC